MTDDELIQDFIRVQHSSDAISLKVCSIGWNHPCSPHSTWSEFARLPADADQSEIDAAIQKVLTNPDFFSVCEECNRRLPDGWMLGSICHSCGEKNHGIVF